MNRHRLDSSFELFHTLQILPLKHLFYYNTLKIFFRKCGFWQFRFSDRYNLRGNTLHLALIPTHNVQHYLNAFNSIAPQLYNKLPRRIINENSLTKILKETKRWLFKYNHDQIKQLIRIIT